MAGLSSLTPIPTRIVVHQQSKYLEIAFNDGRDFKLNFEYLRVYSPSAEVQGHGPGQEVLQVGKQDVWIEALDAVGNYGVQPLYSDGHNTGIYTWAYLYELGDNEAAWWQAYLDKLAAAGASRVAATETGLASTEIKRKGCGHEH